MKSFKPQVESLESRNLPSSLPIGLAYHGGPVLAHVQVEAIFYGTYWNTSDGGARAKQLETAIKDLIGGSYMDGLSSLGVGRGSLDHVDVVNNNNWISNGHISQESVEDIIQNQVNAGRLPQPGMETLYLFIGPKGVTDGGDFHDQLMVGRKVAPYAQIQFNYDHVPENQILADQTGGITHEVVEAATNPLYNSKSPYGTGWWFDNVPVKKGNEICDVAEGPNVVSGTHDGYEVSPYWKALGETDAYFASHYGK